MSSIQPRLGSCQKRIGPHPATATSYTQLLWKFNRRLGSAGLSEPRQRMQPGHKSIFEPTTFQSIHALLPVNTVLHYAHYAHHQPNCNCRRSAAVPVRVGESPASHGVAVEGG
jgi:hypothetical protein